MLVPLRLVYPPAIGNVLDWKRELRGQKLHRLLLCTCGQFVTVPFDFATGNTCAESSPPYFLVSTFLRCVVIGWSCKIIWWQIIYCLSLRNLGLFEILARPGSVSWTRSCFDQILTEPSSVPVRNLDRTEILTCQVFERLLVWLGPWQYAWSTSYDVTNKCTAPLVDWTTTWQDKPVIIWCDRFIISDRKSVV